MRRFLWLLCVGLALFSGSLLFGTACRGRQPEPEPQPQQQYTPTATIKDLMQSIVDPSADVVWESVTTVVTPNGIEERVPKTEEEWASVRRGAVRLVEAPNLLLVPGRHVARPGEKSEAPGVELEPHQMEELVNKDREGWVRRVNGLRDASATMLEAIEARDREKIFEAGEHLERACENCHVQYWYPNQVLPPGYSDRDK